MRKIYPLVIVVILLVVTSSLAVEKHESKDTSAVYFELGVGLGGFSPNSNNAGAHFRFQFSVSNFPIPFGFGYEYNTITKKISEHSEKVSVPEPGQSARVVKTKNTYEFDYWQYRDFRFILPIYMSCGKKDTRYTGYIGKRGNTEYYSGTTDIQNYFIFNIFTSLRKFKKSYDSYWQYGDGSAKEYLCDNEIKVKKYIFNIGTDIFFGIGALNFWLVPNVNLNYDENRFGFYTAVGVSSLIFNASVFYRSEFGCKHVGISLSLFAVGSGEI